MGSLNPFKPKPTVAPAPQPVALPSIGQAGPAAPAAAAAPATPPSSSDPAVQQAAADELKKLKTQRGRAATILTSSRGVLGDDSTGGGLATKALLGG